MESSGFHWLRGMAGFSVIKSLAGLCPQFLEVASKSLESRRCRVHFLWWTLGVYAHELTHGGIVDSLC